MRYLFTLLVHLFLLPLLLVVTTAEWVEHRHRPWPITWLLVVDYFDRHPVAYAHASYIVLAFYGVVVISLLH